MTDTSRYTDTLLDALHYAADKHRQQVRKQTDIPYLAHLLAVASAIMEAGGTETEMVAGLLHDVIEDVDGVTAEEIRLRFGEDVHRIVLACSDYLPERDGPTKPLWRERKQRHLDELRNAPSDVLLVTAADKIHNGESILRDLELHGQQVWGRFNETPPNILWYYDSVLQLVQKGSGNAYAVQRLEAVVSGLRAAVNDIQL